MLKVYSLSCAVLRGLSSECHRCGQRQVTESRLCEKKDEVNPDLKQVKFIQGSHSSWKTCKRTCYSTVRGNVRVKSLKS